MADIESFLSSRGIQVWTHDGINRSKKVRKSWIGFICPRCMGSKVHLGFNLISKRFSCWNCGKISAFEVFHLWFPNENVNVLLQQLGFFDPYDPHGLRSIHEPVAEITGKFLPPSPIYPLANSVPHQDYLASRGLDWRQIAERYAVGAILQASNTQFNNRLFIPIHDMTGTPVSWTTRSIVPDANIPHLSAAKKNEVVSIKTLLYGMNYVTYYDPIIVVEGAADMWRINQTRPHSAVASVGKGLTPAQLQLISKFAVRVFCFDGESITQQQAKEYCHELSVYPGITHNVCLDADDPAKAPQSEIDALLEFTFGLTA